MLCRLAGQVCLKEKASLATSVEAARKMAVGDGEHITMKDSAQVEQQLGTVAEVEVEGVEIGKRNLESRCEALACEPNRKGVEAGTECDKVIPRSEDVMSDTAAKGTAAGRGNPRRGDGIPEVHVCSNSSENVSSGLSDEGCAVSRKGSGTIPVAGVLDDGSGIGKCCSSDDVDMRVRRNPNALSVLEEPTKVVGSPSSLGCPSSSNMGKRPVVKRSVMRVSKGIDDHEVEAEPVTSTGKWFHHDLLATCLFS